MVLLWEIDSVKIIKAIPPRSADRFASMNQKTSLELKGTILAYPAAEILLELSQAGLSGSVRFEQNGKKAIVYFLDGDAIYSVSNEKQFRLAEFLISQQLITKEFAAKHVRLPSDLQFAEAVSDSGIISNEDLNTVVGAQCSAIVAAIVNWREGEWVFSPHNRLKPGINYSIELDRLLLDHGREIDVDSACIRLQNPNEWFGLRPVEMNNQQLQPREAFLLSRLDSQMITINQLTALSGLTREEALQIVYSLWLGGYLSRRGRSAAFSDERIGYLKTADLQLKKEHKPQPPSVSSIEAIPIETEKQQAPQEQAAPFDLESTLKRIESADDYYSVLDIDPSAKVPDIRKAYFRLAKSLHPDLYHNDEPELLHRVERAFTHLAQAHETLKGADSRQGYDIKMRNLEKERESGKTSPDSQGRQLDQAAADFERGLALQLEGEFEAALPYLARAAHYAPKNARYRAQYGKTLSMDESQRHKAEKELATAVQLDPGSPAFRLMLAEFFVRYKLIKRAEGELSRLLETSPGHKEALAMLDSLQAKSLN
jgi:curved DNA-binding protein CbpA